MNLAGLMLRGLADEEQWSPGSMASCASDWTDQESLGTSLNNPRGEPQENQLIWEDSDGDRMLLESKMTEILMSY